MITHPRVHQRALPQACLVTANINWLVLNVPVQAVCCDSSVASEWFYWYLGFIAKIMIVAKHMGIQRKAALELCWVCHASLSQLSRLGVLDPASLSLNSTFRAGVLKYT